MSELEQHIDDFINGKLSIAEQKAFKLLIEKDDQLRERVNVYLELNDILSDRKSISITEKSKRQKQYEELFSDLDGQRIKESIDRVESDYFKELEAKKNSSYIRPFVLGLIILLLTVILYLFLDKWKTSNKIYASLNDYTYLPSMTSRSDENNLAKGEELFYNNKYKEALDYFKDYLETENGLYNSQVELYIACCLLELSQNQDAILRLEKITNSNSMDRGIAQWYLVSAYLRSNQKNQAINTLNAIASDKSNFNYSKALMILDDLSKSAQ